MIDDARRLASLGLAVFPLKARSKEPATAHGFKDATKDLSKIGDWAGVAVATGMVSGVCVIDIDPRNGGDLDKLPGAVPTTWECLTGGGGRHLYLRITAPMRSRKLAEGIDLKADGGYVVAPPSIHPSGGIYAWELSAVPGEIQIGDAPAWLTDAAAAADAREAVAQPLSEPNAERLSANTLRFLQFGAKEGERNNKLYAAACDMAGCGFSFVDAAARLAPAAARCGMGTEEVSKSIQSAFSVPRSPAVREMGADLPAHLRIMEPETNQKLPETAPTVKPSTPANRGRVSNVVDGMREGPDGPVPVCYQKPIDAIGMEMLEATGGWPKNAGGLLFVEQTGHSGPEARWIKDQTELFGYLHEVSGLRWHNGKCLCPVTKTNLIAVTKAEFYPQVRDSIVEKFTAVSLYPHEPRMGGVYYMGLELPQATGKHLEEFMAALNPETETDRVLLMASLLTPGWGGEPGTRPLFVFTSKYGRGAGKTATASAIGDIWGGGVLLNARDNWQDICKRIMSSNEREARVFIFDNVKGQFGGEGIEAATTAKWITGWRTYVGSISRPNDATYFVTFNSPQLSPDLTLRAVCIAIGSPKHGVAFVKWAADYIRRNRLHLIADALAVLRTPAREMPIVDRWQDWMREVLSKIPGGVEAAAEIMRRRPEMDSESEDRETWIHFLADIARDKMGGEVSAAEIHAKAIERKLWKTDPTRSESHDRQKCLGWVEGMLAGTGALTGAKDDNGKKRMCLDSARGARSRVYIVKDVRKELGGPEDEPDLNIPI